VTAARQAQRLTFAARQTARAEAGRRDRETTALSPEGRALLLAAAVALFPPGHPLAPRDWGEDVTA
jgi:hypothetical protein